ncbi:hypothetical protein, partial [Pseudacidovorax intermedius]|uniref:hypothetical protein n=1 Tax=Pseudacidovorax intermedius TaxID=433924 RepID=UPI0019D36E63
FFFFLLTGPTRDLPFPLRRQRQMWIRDGVDGADEAQAPAVGRFGVRAFNEMVQGLGHGGLPVFGRPECGWPWPMALAQISKHALPNLHRRGARRPCHGLHDCCLDEISQRSAFPSEKLSAP